MDPDKNDQGLEWKIGVWDRISELYAQEVDRRFVPVVEAVVERAALKPGERVLDLGTGTGSVAVHAAAMVGRDGSVIGNDISSDMLLLAKQRVTDLGLENVEFREGRAEAIPAEDSTFDVVLASLSLMYVIDRAAAAREIARVLRPAGRLVAAVWAAPAECDIVTFQTDGGQLCVDTACAGRRSGRAGRYSLVPQPIVGSRYSGQGRAPGARFRFRRLRIGLGGPGWRYHRTACT